jgi:2,3-diketo-5-methylthio-1-phosphopentane phosphatase
MGMPSAEKETEKSCQAGPPLGMLPKFSYFLEPRLTRNRDVFREMLESVKPGFAECIEILKSKMKLDPYFLEFYNWAKENNVPIVVVSSGMIPIIQALFEAFLGHTPDPRHLTIVANDVESRDGKDINSPGGWQIKYHDNRLEPLEIFYVPPADKYSHFGHDKSLEIKPYAALPADKRPTLLYAGDGMSDLSAARETDLLFAKKGQGRFSSFSVSVSVFQC